MVRARFNILLRIRTRAKGSFRDMRGLGLRSFRVWGS